MIPNLIRLSQEQFQWSTNRVLVENTIDKRIVPFSHHFYFETPKQGPIPETVTKDNLTGIKGMIPVNAPLAAEAF